MTMTVQRDSFKTRHTQGRASRHDKLWFRHSMPLRGHQSCVNGFALSLDERILATGGDERRILLWDPWNDSRSMTTPVSSFPTTHTSNIFGIGIDCLNKRTFSVSEDKGLEVHDLLSGQLVYPLRFHNYSIYDGGYIKVACHPEHPEIVLMASIAENQHATIMDLRIGITRDYLPRESGRVNAVTWNPANPCYFVMGGAGSPQLMDLRYPSKYVSGYNSPVKDHGSHTEVSHLTFNQHGNLFLSCQQGFLPTLYSTFDQYPITVFYGDGYRNEPTIKTVCFAGDDDEYVVAGSDNKSIFIWDIPPVFRPPFMPPIDGLVKNQGKKLSGTPYARLLNLGVPVKDEPWQVISGIHKSLVNNVIYHRQLRKLYAGGVEKTIWQHTPYDLGRSHSDKDIPEELREDEHLLSYFDFVARNRAHVLGRENEFFDVAQSLYDNFFRVRRPSFSEDDHEDDMSDESSDQGDSHEEESSSNNSEESREHQARSAGSNPQTQAQTQTPLPAFTVPIFNSNSTLSMSEDNSNVTISMPLDEILRRSIGFELPTSTEPLPRYEMTLPVDTIRMFEERELRNRRNTSGNSSSNVPSQPPPPQRFNQLFQGLRGAFSRPTNVRQQNAPSTTTTTSSSSSVRPPNPPTNTPRSNPTTATTANGNASRSTPTSTPNIQAKDSAKSPNNSEVKNNSNNTSGNSSKGNSNNTSNCNNNPLKSNASGNKNMSNANAPNCNANNNQTYTIVCGPHCTNKDHEHRPLVLGFRGTDSVDTKLGCLQDLDAESKRLVNENFARLAKQREEDRQFRRELGIPVSDDDEDQNFKVVNGVKSQRKPPPPLNLKPNKDKASNNTNAKVDKPTNKVVADKNPGSKGKPSGKNDKLCSDHSSDDYEFPSFCAGCGKTFDYRASTTPRCPSCRTVACPNCVRNGIDPRCRDCDLPFQVQLPNQHKVNNNKRPLVEESEGGGGEVFDVQQSGKYCPCCKAENDTALHECFECGYAQDFEVTFTCPQCGEGYARKVIKCLLCGHSPSSAAAAAAAAITNSTTKKGEENKGKKK